MNLSGTVLKGRYCILDPVGKGGGGKVYLARDLELGQFMLLGKGEENTGGRRRDSITSDGMEAMIGAIYLDGGMQPAKAFIDRFIL